MFESSNHFPNNNSTQLTVLTDETFKLLQFDFSLFNFVINIYDSPLIHLQFPETIAGSLKIDC